MAITNYGYEGELDEVGFALAVSLAGGVSYGVLGSGDLAVTNGVGDRAVSIAAGTAVGAGVRSVNPAPITKNLASVSSGSRWDLIVLRRDWGTNTSTVEVITGTSTPALPTRQTTIGDKDDQPLALCRVQAGNSAVVEIIDLRVWCSDGGAFAKHELVLSFLNRIGTQVAIGDSLWLRVLDVTNAPMWRKTSLIEDSDWVEGERNPGWSWNFCQFRRIGKTVFFRLAAGRAVGWATGNGLAVAPAGMRPDRAHYAASVAPGNHQFEFQPSGSIIAAANAPANSLVTVTGSYPVSL